MTVYGRATFIECGRSTSRQNLTCSTSFYRHTQKVTNLFAERRPICRKLYILHRKVNSIRSLLQLSTRRPPACRKFSSSLFSQIVLSRVPSPHATVHLILLYYIVTHATQLYFKFPLPKYYVSTSRSILTFYRTTESRRSVLQGNVNRVTWIVDNKTNTRDECSADETWDI